MPDLLIRLSSDFHIFGAVVSLLVSLIGAVLGGSVKSLSNRAIEQRKPEIKAESEQNFRSSIPSIIGAIQAANARTNSAELAHHQNSIVIPAASQAHDGTTRARNQVRRRLEEIIEERERQQSTAKWSRRTSRILTGGQYIVGAVLTTSIAQSVISRTWLSVLGLVVILCSAAKQHFHIDEDAQSAEIRHRKLRSLVRYAQDQIAILEIKSDKGEDRTDAYISLLNEITQSLSTIESADAPYLPKQAADAKSK